MVAAGKTVKASPVAGAKGSGYMRLSADADADALDRRAHVGVGARREDERALGVLRQRAARS